MVPDIIFYRSFHRPEMNNKLESVSSSDSVQNLQYDLFPY